MENKATGQEAGLRSDIGLLSALSLVVGMVLGAGAFMKPPAVLAAAGDSTWALAAWVIGGMLSMAGGLTLCELGVLFPRTGGVYVYLEELYGEKTAFLYGWMLAVIGGPATIGGLTGYFSSVFCLLFSIPDYYSVVIGAAVLGFVLFVNSIGVKEAGYLQTTATCCKLAPIILLTVFGLWKGNGQVLFMDSGMGPSLPFSAAVLATLFAYDGWAQVAAVAGEIKNPGKILPQAVIGGLSFLVVVYIAINIALLKVLPANEMVALGHDASSIAAQKLFGLTGGNLVAVGIMVSILGGLNGYVMTLSRIIYVMGTKRQLIGAELWGRINADSHTPVNAMALMVGLAYVYSRLFDADRLSNIAVFTIWIFYLLTFIGVFIARRKHRDMPRTYKVPFYPLTPLIAAGGAVYVIFGMLGSQPVEGVFSVALTLLGLPMYYYMAGGGVCGFQMPRLKARTVVGAYTLVIVAVLLVSVQMFDLRPQIRIATEPSLPPFVFQQNGVETGFDIELMNVLAERSGYKVIYRPIPLEELTAAIDKNWVDGAICSLSITAERQQTVNFSQPYMTTGGLALLVPKNSAIRSAADLSGKVVGVYRGSTSEAYVANLAGVRVETFHASTDMIKAYNQGLLSAIIYDRPLLEYFLMENMIADGVIVENLDREDYAIALSKKNRVLNEKLNKALDDMRKTGELDKLYKKWFGKEM